MPWIASKKKRSNSHEETLEQIAQAHAMKKKRQTLVKTKCKKQEALSLYGMHQDRD